MKYIVVTGGVVSGLGKGITISSIGRVLKASGLRVTSIKIDPYLNVDAGTMSPFEHGETFVLNDGGETDLDLGNYERFLDVTLTGRHNITSGKIYDKVIKQERRGDYLGKTVQIVPHATDAVQEWILEVAQISVDGTGQTPDVCLLEVGGTVGDIESMVFLEALRQFQFKVGRDNIMFMHVSLVPVLGTAGEQKTKPTQHSVKDLMSLGLSPDVIVCRSTDLLSESTKHKISTFCHVSTDHIIAVHDVSNLYHVPLLLTRQGIHSLIRNHLKLDGMLPAPDLAVWSTMAHLVDNLHTRVEIAMVGKYNGQSDSYLSVLKALNHSAILLQTAVDIIWIDSSDLEASAKSERPEKHKEAWEALRKVKGVLIPGGFGVRGVEGKIAAARYARENGVPCLGVCLGMQVMVIEYARHVLGLSDANSTEFDASTSHPAIIFMPEGSTTAMGGTMRLGARATTIAPGSLAAEVYGFTRSASTAAGGAGSVSGAPAAVAAAIGNTSTPTSATAATTAAFAAAPAALTVLERHRHRYEVNPTMVASLQSAGLLFSGRCSESVRMEISELSPAVHPYYLGTQYHPEFLSRPTRPSPPFYSFVAAACGQRDKLSLAGELRLAHEESLRLEAARVASPEKRNRNKRPLEGAAAAAEAPADSTPAKSGRAVGFCVDTSVGGGLPSPSVVSSPHRMSNSNKTAEMILPKPLKFDV